MLSISPWKTKNRGQLRLLNAQTLGRAGQVQFFRYDDEVAQQPELHSGLLFALFWSSRTDPLHSISPDVLTSGRWMPVLVPEFRLIYLTPLT